MNDASDEAGISEVLIERFANHRLPRILAIKERVDEGEILGDVELEFLEQVIRDAQENEHLVESIPDCRDLFGRVAHLYSVIMNKALENEAQR
jgi:hypothetical protein